MPVLTFRVEVPASTPAVSPVKVSLISGAPAIQSIMIWSPSSNMAINKSGYRLNNRLGTCLIPDMGSTDSFTFGSGESGWAPIPPTPKALSMGDQVIEGPPHILQFSFYNTDAALILVAGFVVVRDAFAQLAQNAMIYEFLTSKGAPVTDVSPETKTELSSKEKANKTFGPFGSHEKKSPFKINKK